MTGRIFLKLIVGVFGLLLLALVTVDYFATNVAQENYVQNLTQQLTDKGRMLALTFPSPESLDAAHARRMAQAVGGRITVVRADGKVLVDTEANAAPRARGIPGGPLPQTDSSESGQLEQTLNETAENLQQTVSQLQHEHSELEKLERIRKDFVINVSHELRTPLASIQGYTETLIDGALHDPAHNMRFLGIIRHNAERLARLTADRFTLSPIAQKRRQFYFAPLPPSRVIRGV